MRHRRKPRASLSPEAIADILNRLRAGETRQALAADLDLSLSYVSSLAQRNGIAAPSRRPRSHGERDYYLNSGIRAKMWERAAKAGPVLA